MYKWLDFHVQSNFVQSTSQVKFNFVLSAVDFIRKLTGYQLLIQALLYTKVQGVINELIVHAGIV